MKAASDSAGQVRQMTLGEGAGLVVVLVERFSSKRQTRRMICNLTQSVPGKAIATSLHNNNHLLNNPTYSHSMSYLKITGSCRYSWRQLSANFRESSGTPNACI
jgi:hypothetical protein